MSWTYVHRLSYTTKVNNYNPDPCVLTGMFTVKPETLASGNFDEFGKLRSNRQTLTFQSKAIKQNKCLLLIKVLQCKAK